MSELLLTPHARARFLQVLANTCNVTAAAQASGVSRQRIYQVRAAEPDFAALWDDALQMGYDALEAEARRRALDGVDEPVFYKGEQVGSVKRHSDPLMMFLLKAYRSKFRESAPEAESRIPLSDTELAIRIASLLHAAGVDLSSA